MGEAKRRGTFDERRANPKGYQGSGYIPMPRFLHVSKSVYGVTGITYINPNKLRSAASKYRCEMILKQRKQHAA